MAEALGTAVGVISLSIQACQGLMSFYYSWKDCPSEIETIYKSVADLSGTLEILDKTLTENPLNGNSENVLKISETCQAGLNEIERKLVKAKELKRSDTLSSKAHDQGRRLMYPFREKSLVKLKETVSDIRANLNLALDHLHFQTTIQTNEQLGTVSSQTKHIVSEITSIRSHQEDKKRHAIIDWLSPLNPFKTQIDMFNRRQDGTGEWFFETKEFQNWFSRSERTLWCYGQPGAGKTILASAIIDKLQRQLLPSSEVGFAFVYCNYRGKDIQTLVNLLSSVVQQLVRCMTDVPAEIIAVYEQHQCQHTNPTDTEYFNMLESLIAHFSCVYIVVDALDECFERNETRTKFTKKLLKTEVQLLCTSRYLGDIKANFATASHLEIRARDSDIKRYLIAQITQIPRLRDFCSTTKDLQNAIVEELVKKSDGMFLLAQLHLEEIKTKTTVGTIRKALNELPVGLEDTYKHTLERINSQWPDESKLAMNLLSWITHAMRPLKVEEIRHAMAVLDLGPNEMTLNQEYLPSESLLITVCSGIVTIDNETNLIRLVHYSTEEYFEKHRTDIFPSGQASLAQTCIRYLSMNPFAQGPSSTDQEFENRLNTYKLLEYASRNWGHHSRGYLEETGKEQILSFLAPSNSLSSVLQVIYCTTYSSKDGWSPVIPRNDLFGSFSKPLNDGWSLVFSQTVSPVVLCGTFGLGIILDQILKNGGDIEARDFTGATALHRAAQENQLNVMQLLLDKGANIEAKDPHGATPLFRAAASGNLQAIGLLLACGANKEARDVRGCTPLRFAVSNTQEDAVRFLFEKGADVDTRNDDSEDTPLHIVVGGQADPEMVELLLKCKANTELYNFCKETPLYQAVDLNVDPMIVKALLDHGANANARIGGAWDWTTPFHIAVKKCSATIVELFLDKGADIEARKEMERTPLHEAIIGGSWMTVQLLLDRGADIDAQDDEGSTPLYLAIESGRYDYAKLLIEKGASMKPLNHRLGKSILVLAIEQDASIARQHAVYASQRKREMKPRGPGKQ